MQIGQKFSIAIHILLSCEFFKDEKNTSEFLAGTVGTNPVIVRNKEYKNSDVKVVHKDIFELKTKSDVLWTYVSPAGDYDADGARTDKYVLGNDHVILNSQNESYISYADLAIAIIDELKNRNFVQKRFTAVGERA